MLEMLERHNGSRAKARVIIGSARVSSLTDMSAIQEPILIIIIKYLRFHRVEGKSWAKLRMGGVILTVNN